jgi:hypothetical protein
MCLSKLFCGNDCTWAWILFIIGIVLLLDNNCGGESCGCGCGNNYGNNGCYNTRDCGCNTRDCGCC